MSYWKFLDLWYGCPQTLFRKDTLVRQSKIHLRVISKFGGMVLELTSLFGAEFSVEETGATADWKKRLKVGQAIVSVCNNVINWALKELRTGAAAEEQYWLEVNRLSAAGYFEKLGEAPVSEVRANETSLLHHYATCVCDFFSRPGYVAEISQRHALPIFTKVHWKAQVTMLAETLSAHSVHPGHLQVVGREKEDVRKVEVRWEPAFEEMCEQLWIPSRVREGKSMYVLCGVHGGAQTHDDTVAETLAQEGRLPLTFGEALTLYTAHPNFLLENKAVILLGDVSLRQKYPAITYDAEKAVLSLSFISAEEADRGLAPSNVHPSQFHGTRPAPTYGKPSAGLVLTL